MRTDAGPARSTIWRRGAWFAFGLILGLWIATWYLWSLAPIDGSPIQVVGIFGGFLSFTVVGTVIALKRPGNRIAWLMLVIGGGAAAMSATMNYSYFGLFVRDTPPPLVHVAAWLQNWLWVAMFAGFGLVFLLFPDGRFLSPRWRWVGVALGTVVATFAATGALYPRLGIGNDVWGLSVANPFGSSALEPVLEVIDAMVGAVAVCALLLAVVSASIRYRRSRGVERAQLKWFAYGAGLTLAVLVAPLPAPLDVVELVLFWVIPLTVGTALLRYRLYDIDRLVGRTVTYGAVTLLLVGLYAGGVIGLGWVVRVVTGGAGGDLVVAASTLMVAAAFGPVRRRVQSLVDQRFNRARYDASREVERFGVRLRDEVDLASLAGDLRLVVEETVHPRSVGLWLPEEAVR